MKCQYKGGRSSQIWNHLDHKMSVLGCRSVSRSRGGSAKFELILTTRSQYWRGRSARRFRGRPAIFNSSWLWDVSTRGVDLPNLKSSWPQDVSAGRVDLSADLGVDLENFNSSWPQDVSTREVDLPNLKSSWPQDVSTEGRSVSRSRRRSAKFELILITRCQYQGVDLPAALGVDLENFNSSLPQDVSPGRDWNLSRSRGRSAKFELILTMRCLCWRDWLANWSRGIFCQIWTHLDHEMSVPGG